MEETIVVPLWAKLRPQTLGAFLGNPILKNPDAVADLEKRTGPILVHGGIGCGKTSVALVLSSAILGARMPQLDAIWNEHNGRTVYGRHLDARTFDIAHFKDTSTLAGRQVFIIDEAQDFTPTQITFLRGLVEKDAFRSTYMFVTSDIGAFKAKDKGAFFTRCFKLHMEPLGPEDRTILAQRGWTAMSKAGSVPADLLKAFAQYDLSQPVNSPRVILDIVEKVAYGMLPIPAIKECLI